MSVCGKESHLTLWVAAIGTVRVGLDEFPDSETVRGFLGRDGEVLAHELVSWFESLRKCGYSLFHAALCPSVLSARNRCTRWTAIAPSPTADATRLTLPARASPTANIPGILVSSRSGGRRSGERRVGQEG